MLAQCTRRNRIEFASALKHHAICVGLHPCCLFGAKETFSPCLYWSSLCSESWKDKAKISTVPSGSTLGSWRHVERWLPHAPSVAVVHCSVKTSQESDCGAASSRMSRCSQGRKHGEACLNLSSSLELQLPVVKIGRWQFDVGSVNCQSTFCKPVFKDCLFRGLLIGHLTSLITYHTGHNPSCPQADAWNCR